MTGSEFFWFFMMFSMAQPWIQKRMLESSRLNLIHQFEKQRKSRLIVLIHRQETMSFLGFPVARFIDVHDAEEVIRAIHLTHEEVPIDLVLHTPGGLVMASLQIARAVAAHKAKVTVFVPHHAMSGGTLIALAADEIVMDHHAVLGPVDPQLGGFPAASLLKLVEKKSVDDIDDKTLIMADVAEKAISQLKKEVIKLLGDKHPPDKAREIAERLATGTWTHDHPISCDEALEIGLPVKTDMPELIYRLMTLYPQPYPNRVPTVEYNPTRYRPGIRE